MDLRRAAPPLIAAVVVGALVATFFVHRDANPLPDSEAAARDRREAVDLYAAGGEDKRLTGEQDAARSALPAGHPPLDDAPVDDAARAATPHPPAAATGTAASAARQKQPFVYTVPPGWKEETPSTSMRAAQWALAPEGGSGEGGQVALFIGIRGSVADNVSRWEKEFGGARAATRERVDGSLTVTRVAIEGTFSGGMAATGAGPREGWRLLGAVVQTPAGSFFVKATGPAAVMAREEAAFDAFLASIGLP